MSGETTGKEISRAPRRLTTIIVDDDSAIREGLKRMLEALGADVIAEAGNGRSGVELARSLIPELILLDVSMPVMGGLAAARELRHTLPELTIIVVSQHSNKVYAEEAMQIGVSGYVLKSRATTDLRAAIDAAQSGRTFVSPAVRMGSGTGAYNQV